MYRIGEMTLTGGTLSYSKKNLYQCHFYDTNPTRTRIWSASAKTGLSFFRCSNLIDRLTDWQTETGRQTVICGLCHGSGGYSSHLWAVPWLRRLFESSVGRAMAQAVIWVICGPCHGSGGYSSHLWSVPWLRLLFTSK